ncbi:acyclic terpene utilization AtuA family protein [Halomonas dongshanensis]|uniref:DUF1446 domain-containing protein n=1 Tax=Halomonas dongshanensis TaxID=2890835 RepID=A0ABT2ECC2_9GAMM|nr:acyclic terpene utilization AtuA family protein [Halomonas dongshanensis]MCS2609227.1 DUF1446 domain-containing protein [Halomonas dongshanensis]
MHKVRIGAGAGYSGDRIDPAVDLAKRGNLDFLVFECLAERTITNAQLQLLSSRQKGYDPFLVARMQAVLGLCHQNNIRIITNMGAAAPLAAAQCIRDLAHDMGLDSIRVAAVVGDDILTQCTKDSACLKEEHGYTIAEHRDQIISANAYIGAESIAKALDKGANVVVTGRAADPALFLGPLIHSFKWKMNDWDKLGKGTAAGHLLECAGQICGGYFADPGKKDVPQLAHIGFPFGDIYADGRIEISKLDNTGGYITPATVKEQLLYEIHDPARYLQPDVIADFSNVWIEEIATNRVRIHDATGHAKTNHLKVSISYHDGFIGEGQISYAGIGAVARAQLARDIIKERLTENIYRDLRVDFIGMNALHGDQLSSGHEPYEVRLRVLAKCDSREDAERIGNEVEALYTNGPSGGGGAWKSTRPAVFLTSPLIAESHVPTSIIFMETANS